MRPQCLFTCLFWSLEFLKGRPPTTKYPWLSLLSFPYRPDGDWHASSSDINPVATWFSVSFMNEELIFPAFSWSCRSAGWDLTHLRHLRCSDGDTKKDPCHVPLLQSQASCGPHKYLVLSVTFFESVAVLSQTVSIQILPNIKPGMEINQGCIGIPFSLDSCDSRS